jgi:hypothetical protein
MSLNYEFDGSQAAAGARLDAEHTPAPVDYRTDRIQRRMLARAVEIIRERVPGAVFADLQTSDQDDYGFVLAAVTDEVGTDLLPAWDDVTHPLAGLSDEVSGELCNLEWDGVVGEDEYGNVTIDLRGRG